MGAVAGVLLTPGAGAGRDHHGLLAIEAALASVPARAGSESAGPRGAEVPGPASRYAVRRVDFPYRLAGRRVPDRPAVAVAHVVAQAEAFAADLRVSTDRLVIGGRSYGGRMCSMAVAEGLAVAGLVLLSYPLHPPGKPERLRVDHFERITVPTLFVSGDRDPFGSPAEFAAHVGAIAGPVTQVWVPGAHDVRGRDGEAAEAVADWIAGLG